MKKLLTNTLLQMLSVMQ